MYVMIKELCSHVFLLKYLIEQLVCKLVPILENKTNIFVNSSATAGIIPAWLLSRNLSKSLLNDVPMVYMRSDDKKGGHNERLVGINHPKIQKVSEVIIMDDLINYGSTTREAVNVFRSLGYKVNYVCCILNYAHKTTKEKLDELGVIIVSPIDIPHVLEYYNKQLSDSCIKSYESFLQDNIVWQLDRSYVIPQESSRIAINKGYNMMVLDYNTALSLGAPQLIHHFFYYLNIFMSIISLF